MFVSGGNLVRKGGEFRNQVVWSGTTATFGNDAGAAWLWQSYSTMYRRQLWVAVVVNKRAGMVSRLPLPVYQRGANGGRDIVRDHPYARLLRRPNRMQDRVTFWNWITATRDIFGESMAGKIRDPGGRPVELVPLHPTAMTYDADTKKWTFDNGTTRFEGIPRADVLHFSSFNPDSLWRAMSPLEPLRATLENEAAARAATSSFWQRGARPGVALTHPGNLSKTAADRLKLQWNELTAGAHRTGTTVVLEEGMKPEILTLTSEEAQYIETRKLNREEVVAAYDMPPPAVHILDHATFSNITEQFRSIYRDTAAPVLNYFESVLETQLREPDFGDDVYAEFLLDEVLRGDFETRQAAYRMADYMTIAEKREKENLPFIPGTDRIVINAASIPLDMLDVVTAARTPSTVAQNTVRAVMGRLGRPDSLDDVDPVALVAGLNGDAEAVLTALATAKDEGEDVPAFRQRIRGMEKA